MILPVITATVRVSATGLTHRDRLGDWQQVDHFTEKDMSFTVDYIDPFRGGPGWVPAGRLSALTSAGVRFAWAMDSAVKAWG